MTTPPPTVPPLDPLTLEACAREIGFDSHKRGCVTCGNGDNKCIFGLALSRSENRIRALAPRGTEPGPAKCGGCAHAPHIGPCLKRNGGTAYQCRCLLDTVPPKCPRCKDAKWVVRLAANVACPDCAAPSLGVRPEDRSRWHEFVHAFALEHWPYSHPDDYDPTDRQLIDLCLAAIERDRADTTRELGEAVRILRGVQAYARNSMVPSGEVDAFLTGYDQRWRTDR